jgi:hypothetical protein
MEIEKDWTTVAGLRAFVVMQPMGFRCGYVGVLPGHPLYEVGDDIVAFDLEVHGGVTYCGHHKLFETSGEWWFGFDCAHYGDASSQDIIDILSPSIRKSYNSPDISHKSLEFCVAECERLAEQLVRSVS